ncbi:MAG: hypothetical protein Q8M92_07215, partial [Candidatus Subteraquimicrobiales bacterium]|nr:hypothetical protein [Candidatus Subteraquimicrobiales bacterium]
MENDSKIKEEDKNTAKPEGQATPQENIEQFESTFEGLTDTQGATAPEFVDKIIEDALKHRASDVHLEPQRDIVYIRFRMDGVLYYVGKIQ